MIENNIDVLLTNSPLIFLALTTNYHVCEVLKRIGIKKYIAMQQLSFLVGIVLSAFLLKAGIETRIVALHAALSPFLSGFIYEKIKHTLKNKEKKDHES